MVVVKEGKDDATTVFHPQRFLRPPVVGLDKYWNLYPKKWDEKYFSVFMEDVGLQNELVFQTPKLVISYLLIDTYRVEK